MDSITRVKFIDASFESFNAPSDSQEYHRVAIRPFLPAIGQLDYCSGESS